MTAPGRARAEQALARGRDDLAGKRIFLFPDSQLEVPLARFLARELAAELIEVHAVHHLDTGIRRAHESSSLTARGLTLP